MADDFNYDKAAADLDGCDCPDPEEIYEYRDRRSRDDFMRENGLNPDKYYKRDTGSSGSGSGSSGCFLTSACMQAAGLPDDCTELTVLRQYRDTYLKARPGGGQDIAEYYRIAPGIVSAINRREDAGEIWRSILLGTVRPCVEDILAGRPEQAYQRYKQTVETLKSAYLK